jgi:methionyl-tRNA synthetase
MGVDHGGAHIGMAQQFLHGADVVARLQQMRGERMAPIPTSA